LIDCIGDYLKKQYPIVEKMLKDGYINPNDFSNSIFIDMLELFTISNYQNNTNQTYSAKRLINIIQKYVIK